VKSCSLLDNGALLENCERRVSVSKEGERKGEVRNARTVLSRRAESGADPEAVGGETLAYAPLASEK
jgi:hypothetical protein